LTYIQELSKLEEIILKNGSMTKGIKKYNSFKEAEKDTLIMYANMSISERLSKGMDLEYMAKKLSNFSYPKQDGFILNYET
jgi:hypothetical protein